VVEHDDSLIDAPPSEEELAESARLREALDGKVEDANADLLRAVALAHEPRALDPAENERLVDKALATAKPRRGTVIRVVFGFSAVAAIAASVLVYLSGQTSTPTARVELVPVRSTQALFDKPFESRSSASARIDRIALSREGDLRENRFAKWGVR